MKHMKRISFLLAIMALLFMSFAFPASAAGNEVSIVWGKYSYTFDATGCSTWAELANTADAGYEGLYIADNGYAYFEYDFDNSFPIVDQDGVSVKGTDQITDATYTFGVVSLSFGHEFEHFIKVGSGEVFWFDVAGVTDNGTITTDEGEALLYYQIDGVGQFGIYNAAGQRVDENDEVTETHYTLKLLNYSFTIQEYKDGAASGTVHTLTASGVDNWNLYSFLDSDTVFECETLGDCYFTYYDEANDIVALSVTSAAGKTEKLYLLTLPDLTEMTHPGSSIEPAAYYIVDPCELDHHIYSAYQTVTEPTCTEQGTAERVCKYCGDVEQKVLPATGHDYYWGKCRNCGTTYLDKVGEFVGGIFGGDDGTGSAGDKNIFDQVGDKVDEFGNSIKDWADGIKNDTTSFFKTIMTVIFIVLLIFLIPKGLKLVRKIIEGIGEAARSIVVFFQWMLQPVTRKRKRAYRR